MSILSDVLGSRSNDFPAEGFASNHVDAKLENFLAQCSENVRNAAHSFRLGVKLATDHDETQMRAWNDRLGSEIGGLDPATPEDQILGRIRRLKEDVVVSVIRPSNYSKVLRLWVWTVVLGVLTSFLIGDQSLLTACEGLSGRVEGSDGLVPAARMLGGRFQEFCGAAQGHFNGYIAFRYAVFGTLLGGALFGSFSTAKAQFVDSETVGDSLTRPVLRGIIALALAYVLSMLVAGDKLQFNLLGFSIKADYLEPGRHIGFRDAVSLFVIGLSAAMAADVYLKRLVDSFRASAETAFAAQPKK